MLRHNRNFVWVRILLQYFNLINKFAAKQKIFYTFNTDSSHGVFCLLTKVTRLLSFLFCSFCERGLNMRKTYVKCFALVIPLTLLILVLGENKAFSGSLPSF